MFAGSEERLNRRPLVSLSVIVGAMTFPKERTMKRTLLFSCGILTLISINNPTSAGAQEKARIAAWSNNATGKTSRRYAHG